MIINFSKYLQQAKNIFSHRLYVEHKVLYAVSQTDGNHFSDLLMVSIVTKQGGGTTGQMPPPSVFCISRITKKQEAFRERKHLHVCDL